MNKVYPILFLLLVSACSSSGGALPIDAKAFLSTLDGPKVPTIQETQMETAKAAEKKGSFAQAVQMYQQMLEKDENNADIVIALADALRRNGEYEKSIAAYDSLISKNPENIAAKEGKGLALLSKGDFETPSDIFTEILKQDGKRWKSLNAVGILFSTRSLYPESQKYFEEALRQSPNNVAVMNNLGLAQALNKKFPESVATLSRASSQSSVDSLSRKRIDLNLSMVYAIMGKLDEAEKIAKNYLSGAQLNNNLGLYAHLAKDDQLAKSYLNMALTENTVYYGKAWENLEAISGGNKNDSSKKSGSTSPKKESPSKKGSQKRAYNSEKPEENIASNEPVAISSPVQSLGKIKSNDLLASDSSAK